MNGKKILVIAHNVFDCRTNMGKTLSGFFTGYASDCLAELYVHSEVPTMDICHRYYRVTDTDALKSVLPGNCEHVGRTFSEADIDRNRSTPRTDTGIKRRLYSFGRKRTSLIYSARNTLWRLSGWYSDELKQWIAEFTPDVIFFAAGDYAFAYDIACTISQDFHLPIIMYCCDDYFIHRCNPSSLLGVFVHKDLMRSVRRCASRSTAVITICDKMAEDYRKLFDKPIYTVYTGYGYRGQPDGDGIGIVYLGNLVCGRHRALVDIGRALKRISERTGTQLHLDVYSPENRPEILREMTKENGIVFHGAVDSEAVKRIIAESRLTVHVESFAPEHRRSVMYSVSTKIADLLASGRCIFAYGPGEVASMEYLKEHEAACVVDNPEKLETELENILNDPARRNRIVESAKNLAQRNHNTENVQRRILEIVNHACLEMQQL